MSRAPLRHPLPRLALATALLAAMPLAGWAQTAPAAPSSSPMDAMPGMEGMAMPAAGSSTRQGRRCLAHPHGGRAQGALLQGVDGRSGTVAPAAPACMHHAHGTSPSPAPVPAGAPSTAEGTDGAADQAWSPDAGHDAAHGMPGMEQGPMPGMDRDATGGLDQGAMVSMDHGSTPGGAPGMWLGPMQGGSPPPDARDPDYSAGAGYGPTHGLDMAMEDNPRLGKLVLDQWEAFRGKYGPGQRWDAEAWYGNDYDKFWWRTEGERVRGALEHGDLEALWNHAVAAFWSTQLGVRADAGRGPGRTWAAFGVQGLAPYWFEMEATAYAGSAGRTAARVRAEYELFLTQRLILQPELEANLYGKSDPARRLGAGLADAELGLRLRYEIRREFAPYVGVVWVRRFGGTAGFARADREGVLDRQWVAGLRIWF